MPENLLSARNTIARDDGLTAAVRMRHATNGAIAHNATCDDSSRIGFAHHPNGSVQCALSMVYVGQASKDEIKILGVCLLLVCSKDGSTGSMVSSINHTECSAGSWSQRSAQDSPG